VFVIGWTDRTAETFRPFPTLDPPPVRTALGFAAAGRSPRRHDHGAIAVFVWDQMPIFA
jgi:hypothetical protein